MNNIKSTETRFAFALRKNITETIQKQVRQGTTAMSLDNLRQCTPTPSPVLDGAPRGTNVQWAYAELFERIVRENKSLAVFIIADEREQSTLGGYE